MAQAFDSRPDGGNDAPESNKPKSQDSANSASPLPYGQGHARSVRWTSWVLALLCLLLLVAGAVGAWRIDEIGYGTPRFSLALFHGGGYWRIAINVPDDFFRESKGFYWNTVSTSQYAGGALSPDYGERIGVDHLMYNKVRHRFDVTTYSVFGHIGVLIGFLLVMLVILRWRGKQRMETRLRPQK